MDKFYSSLDAAKEKINWKIEEIIWNVAQRDNMVENTDEMSIYLIIPLFSSSKTEQTKFCYSGFICGSFGGVQRLYFLTWVVAHGCVCFITVYKTTYIFYELLWMCITLHNKWYNDRDLRK